MADWTVLGREPHLELRQEPQGSAPDFLEPDLTQIAGSLLSLLRRHWGVSGVKFRDQLESFFD